MSDKFDKVYNEAIGDTLKNIGTSVKNTYNTGVQKAHIPLAKYSSKNNIGPSAPGMRTYSPDGRKQLRGAVAQDIKQKVQPIGKAITTGYNKLGSGMAKADKLSDKLGGDPRGTQTANILGGASVNIPPGTEQLAKSIGKFHTNPQALFTNPQFSQWAAQATTQQKTDFITALMMMTKPQQP